MVAEVHGGKCPGGVKGRNPAFWRKPWDPACLSTDAGEGHRQRPDEKHRRNAGLLACSVTFHQGRHLANCPAPAFFRPDSAVSDHLWLEQAMSVCLLHFSAWRKETTGMFLRISRGFPGGAVVESLPANAGDVGSSPGLGGSHMPRSNWACEPQLLSLRVWSLCSATREAAMMRGPRTAMKSGPHLPQLEKALAQK